jgi:hypothetical protein
MITGKVGLGYTLATGRLFCKFSDFHEFAEELLGRPIFTHEFADKQLWEELRQIFEGQAKAILEGKP